LNCRKITIRTFLPAEWNVNIKILNHNEIKNKKKPINQSVFRIYFFNYLFKFLNKNLSEILNLDKNKIKNHLVKVTAVNIEIKIHIQRFTANHLIIEVQNQIRIAQVISEETFESLIEVHALSNHISTDCKIFFQVCFSSFILSKIRMFASTAIQIESTIQAIHARVSTTGNQKAQEIFNNQSKMNAYEISAIDATTHRTLY